MSLGDKEVCRSLTRGTPQGGILSPLMWNLLFDELLLRMQEFSAAKSFGYADDGMFLVSGICPNTLVDIAQPVIDCAIAWGKENELQFSTKKTVAILFTRKRKSKPDTKLRINGEELEYSNWVKYLGIKINSRLTWHGHVLERIKKCKGLMTRLRTTIGARWNPAPRLMLWAFNNLVVPALTYGAVVWGNSDITNGIESELQRLVRLAAVGVAPMRKRTPKAGLQVILNLKPLHLVIGECGLETYIRLRKPSNWEGLGKDKKKGHRRYGEISVRP